MSEFWLATAIGAGSGAALLALFARLPERQLADLGYLALISMLAIYIGARLVTGDITDVVLETVGATSAAILVRVLMTRWLPAIGAAILLHGCYDALVGPHTGVVNWYPPLCAGFDLIVGAGLLVILSRKRKAAD